MTHFILVEYFINIIDVTIFFVFMSSFFRLRNENIYSLITAIFLQSAINQIINIYAGTLHAFGFLIMIATSAILAYIIFRAKSSKLMIFTGLFFVLLALCETIVALFLSIFYHVPISEIAQFTTSRYMTVIFSKALLMLILILMKNRFSNIDFLKKAEMKKFYMIIFINLSMLFVIIALGELLNTAMIDNLLEVSILFFGIIIFSVLMIHLLNSFSKHASEEAQWELREQEYINQTKYVNEFDHLIKELKSQRHEFNNHVACIHGLINEDNQVEAKNYIQGVIKKANDLDNIVQVHHPIFSALFNYKLSSAQSKGIKTNLDIHLPEIINVEAIDLSILLSNIIDNAVEENERLAIDNKYLNIRIASNGAYLVFEISNPTDKETFQLSKYKTSKNDDANHGFGLMNIVHVIDKYDGFIDTVVTEGEFTLKIALLVSD